MKIRLKKKRTKLNQVLKLLNEFLYARADIISPKKRMAGFIREWYERIFDEFPPWDKHPFDLVVLKLEYELFKRDYDNADLSLPTKALQNYKASKEFDVEGLSDSLREKIKCELAYEKKLDLPKERKKIKIKRCVNE